MRRFACILGVALAMVLPGAGQAGPCRQALALGLDVSGSVDAAEYRLQVEGIAEALSDPEVARVVLAAPAAPIRLMVYEWSGPSDQHVIAGWSEITDAAALALFTDQLRATRRVAAAPSTAIGSALTAGARFLAQQDECWKRTLDISGDGMSNTGPRPQDLDHVAALKGITVNALVIGAELPRPPGAPSSSGLASYFERHVIRGPEAFVIPADGYAAYRAAMKKKLLRELEGLAVGLLEPDPARALVPPRTQ